VRLSDGHLNYFFLLLLLMVVTNRNEHKLIKRYEAVEVVNNQPNELAKE
jgi:hypothetical protein